MDERHEHRHRGQGIELIRDVVDAGLVPRQAPNPKAIAPRLHQEGYVEPSDGALLGKVLIPETVSNVCFGGAKRNRLFICATTSLYAVYLNTRGAGR
ncbi:hypothetical protein WME94_34945 [Sorangium sp. So ce429]